MASALSGEGVAEVWAKVEAFFEAARSGGALGRRRQTQAISWMHGLIHEALREEFFRRPEVRARLPEMERAVAEGRLPVVSAAGALLALGRG
jgi:LAO/AO transport system kinase